MKYEVTRVEAVAMTIALVAEGKAIPDEKKAAVLDALKRISTSLGKSSSKKAGKTKAQLEEDAKIQEKILGVLDENGKRAGEIGALVGVSQSKATAMLKILTEAGKAVRGVEKGVAKYRISVPVIAVDIDGDSLEDELDEMDELE